MTTKTTRAMLAIAVLVIAVAVTSMTGCSSAQAKEKTPAPAASPNAAPAPAATPDPNAATPDPNATAPDPNATTATAQPVYKVAEDNIVVGRAMTYTVRPVGADWAVYKTALCNVTTANGKTVGRNQFQECVVPLRDIALQICNLDAGWQSRGLAEPTDKDEFEISTGEWCYLDDDAGCIWVAHKSDDPEPQHFDRWLYAQAAPGQAGKMFARIKAELAAEETDLVTRRSEELKRLQRTGVVVGPLNPS